MKKIFDLYGFSDESLSRIAERLGQLLGLSFSPHESEYKGEYFAAGPIGEERITVQSNALPITKDEESEYAEPEFLSFPTVVYVSHSGRADAIRDAIASQWGSSSVHLRRKEL
jgi:hypothetical protein